MVIIVSTLQIQIAEDESLSFFERRKEGRQASAFLFCFQFKPVSWHSNPDIWTTSNPDIRRKMLTKKDDIFIVSIPGEFGYDWNDRFERLLSM